MEDICLFIRCSTDSQEYDRQIFDLTESANRKGYNVKKVIATKISGRKTYEARPDLKELFDVVKQREVTKVIVSEISRLGRNARDIRNTIDFLHSHKVSLIFENLGGIESLNENGEESFAVNIIIHIWAELAQEERRLLSERVKSGMKAARRKGKMIGRPVGALLSEDELKRKYSKLIKDLENGISLNKCAKIHGVSKNTVIKIKKLL